MRLTALLFLFAFGIGVVTDAAAQHRPACAQPVLDELAFLEGEWTVHSRSRLSASPVVWEEAVGAVRFGRMMFDCAVIERLVSSRRGEPFELVRILTARPEGKGLRLAIADSAHGSLYTYDSTPEAPLLFSMQLTTANGEVHLRLRFSEVSRERFVLSSERSVDGGANWDLTGQFVYLKRP